MADDFEFYQGDDLVPYFVIKDGNTPVDLSAWTAATWVASPMTSSTPIITKHKSDMHLDVDPTVEGATVKNCIYVPIVPVDTGLMADVGQFRHELRITLDDMQFVVYPEVGTRATFVVIESLSWNPGTIPPAPRLERVEKPRELELELELEPKQEIRLKRVPKLPREG